jgi:hypothetical protein
VFNYLKPRDNFTLYNEKLKTIKTNQILDIFGNPTATDFTTDNHFNFRR